MATPSKWFDEASETPIIGEQARRLDSFLAAVADGRVDAHEIEAQEARLIQLMKDVEPRLSGELHAKVTELLCELTAYDMMQVLNMMQESKPKTTFHG